MTCSPSGIEVRNVAVFCLEVAYEFALGSLRPRRFQGAEGERSFIAPGHFVVAEVTDAPGIVGAGVRFCFHSSSYGGGETRVEHVRKLPPVTFAALDRKSTRLNSSHLVISYA